MLFGTPETHDGELRVAVTHDDGKPVFSQFDNVTVTAVTEESITFDTGDTPLDQYDGTIAAAAVENSKTWFGRKVQATTIDKAYQPSTGGSLQCLRVENTKVWNTDREDAQVEVGQRCDVVVDLNRLWFVKRHFGAEWIVAQIRVHPPQPQETADPYGEYLFQGGAGDQ